MRSFALRVLSATAALALWAGAARAGTPDVVRLGPAGAGGTLAAPRLVRAPVAGEAARPAPVWTPAGLVVTPPGVTAAGDEVPAGPPVFDPSSESWFASLGGAIVRVAPDGSRRVLVDDVQGRDVDVRARARVAVSREPDDRIVLHRFGPDGVTRTVLLRGPAFFGPRLSPEGDAVLVSESRAEGGHVWLVRLADGLARDLGQGYGPTWAPDGRRVLFARTADDGERLTAAELWQWDLVSGVEAQLTATPDVLELAPAVSPDGRSVAFADGRTGALYVAALPAGW
jgi:hypothetical protein